MARGSPLPILGRVILASLAALILTTASGWVVAKENTAWPVVTDLPREPAIHTGRLPNGLRYVISPNPTPAGAVSIRMRVDAGSFHEAQTDRGLAHFLEHMAFRGTTHVADGDLDAVLSRLGMRRGVDSNAFTSGTQTFFKFDLPKNDAATLDGALMLLRDFAGELILSPTAIEEEKRVIESELRYRDTPSDRIRLANLAFLLKGQPAGERPPGGSLEIVKAATPAQLRAFYRAFYRPERVTMIVVGDVDPDTVVKALRTRFGDWKGQGPAGKDPVLGAPSPAGGVRTITAPDFPAQITVSWLSPATPARTQAEIRESNLEFLGLSIINHRYERTVQASGGRPFAAATISKQSHVRSAEQVVMSFAGDPRLWPQALQSIETIRRQAVEQGVGQAEVDRAVAATSASLDNMASIAPVQSTPYLADYFLSAVDNGGPLRTPGVLARASVDSVRGATAAEVDAALKRVFAVGRPYLFMAGPTAAVGGEAELAAAYKAAAENQLALYDAPPPPKAWPYSDFGPPGQVVEQTRIEELDVTLVRFANGVHLTIKPTQFVRGQITVNAKFGSGRLGLPLDRPTPLWAFQPVVNQGGLKDMSPFDIQAALADSGVTMNFGVLDDGYVLTGGTREPDLDRQLQLMAAQLTAPGWRSDSFDNSRRAGMQAMTNVRNTPGGVLSRDLPTLMRGGDPRWRPADPSDMARTGFDQVRAALEPAFGATPLQVVIVGDVTVERAISAVAATLGALPQRPEPAPPSPASVTLHFPSGGPPGVIEHQGRADQGLALVAWPVGGFADLKTPRDLKILESILVERLTDAIRNDAGAAYGVQSELHISTLFPDFGYLRVSADVPPDKADLFFETAYRLAAELKAKEITPDELERARAPVLQGFLRDRQSNSYWAGQLLDIYRTDMPMRRAALISLIGRIQAVTPAGVRKAATLLDDAKAARLIVRPRAAPAGLAEAAAR